MGIKLHHTIIFSKNKRGSAEFYAGLFGLKPPTFWGPFATVLLDEGTHLHFAEPGVEVQIQHYAFQVDEGRFEEIYARMLEGGLDHWADPQMKLPRQINRNNGGRGVYFLDPSGHGLELLTQGEYPA